MTTARRHYFRQTRLSIASADRAGEFMWRGKQLEEPGTPLPVNIPSRKQLMAAGATTLHDLEGATVEELQDLPGISPGSAERILAALEAARAARGEGSTSIHASFPAFPTLEANGYTTLESLAGHSEKLLKSIGLVDADAKRVFVRVAYDRLPEAFPSRAALEAAAFYTKESLLEEASTVELLTAIPGVDTAAANAILAALEAARAARGEGSTSIHASFPAFPTLEANGYTTSGGSEHVPNQVHTREIRRA
jgi:Holliday junction resolvasome RuvABC DNA-binding subunit